ncbi:phosphotransferase enzyme family protein [Colletotrichum orchidophilum]|uniref:Phosphotransferase enzyme family protein n=1 Tax=Colletotrichum orchidophilum TaxID=1209926 RepID=A0A1G4ASE4_9PEZI|nr:phosphotransferase enzyme family protein [Colletotrichum orchidophilum]OHE92087.1 phosphotransferase enzyme family protein [Colletotrichum orchidophilum]
MSAADTSDPTTSQSQPPASGQIQTFLQSSFFKERRAPTLPSPAEIRARNIEVGGLWATNFNRPPPVIYSSLGLLVKYGGDVKHVEAQTQMMVRERLQGKVPVPEVFGWAEDGRQGFIYMALIEGATLQERWRDLDENARCSVCDELKEMLAAIRALEQDSHDPYVGCVGKQPLREITLADYETLAGPFLGADAVQQFQDAYGIMMASGASPIVFTHADLVAPNIMLSLGPNPKVAAIIDWAQSGWLPSYWEYCKSKRLKLYETEYFSEALEEEWQTKYLPKILDPVDTETCYYPWLYFVSGKGH